MNTKTELLQKCLTEAFAGKMTFLETLQHMSAIHVRWYSANLCSAQKTYYFENGNSHQGTCEDWKPVTPYSAFDEKGVIAAIRAIQRGEIIYPEFMRRIAESGVAVYTVHLKGRKAIYLGPDGDFYVEPFPQ